MSLKSRVRRGIKEETREDQHLKVGKGEQRRETWEEMYSKNTFIQVEKQMLDRLGEIWTLYYIKGKKSLFISIGVEKYSKYSASTDIKEK